MYKFYDYAWGVSIENPSQLDEVGYCVGLDKLQKKLQDDQGLIPLLQCSSQIRVVDSMYEILVENVHATNLVSSGVFSDIKISILTLLNQLLGES